MSKNFKCSSCDKDAAFERHTQFAGIHYYCEVHAKQEDDFMENDSYQFWVQRIMTDFERWLQWLGQSSYPHSWEKKYEDKTALVPPSTKLILVEETLRSDNWYVSSYEKEDDKEIVKGIYELFADHMSLNMLTAMKELMEAEIKEWHRVGEKYNE